MPDREKVVKAINICLGRGKCDECGYRIKGAYSTMDCRKQMMRDAISLLKEQEWKLITEDSDGILHGLPGDDGPYLMTDGKDIWIDEYVDGVADGIFLDSDRDIRDIKAWMYIPELPK